MEKVKSTENMEKIVSAAKKIWDYMMMHQELEKSDLIFVLGSRATQVAEWAAKLWLDGYAPTIIFSGSGSIHNHKPGREIFANTTEAEVFADIAMKLGVPKDAIIIENESQNTGQNFEFTLKKMKELKIDPKKVILVQKPYMERRTYATGKIWLPDVDLIVTSPLITFDDYRKKNLDLIVSQLVGDLQRIKEYPKKGFQIEQEIPDDVWDAYEFLVAQGYDDRLIG